MNRRAMLQALGLAVGAALAEHALAAAEVGALHVKSAASKLDAAQQEMIAQLADLILPRTETPGAIDAGVPAFIEHIVSDWYSAGERTIFVDGLRAVDEFCTRNYGHGFVAVDAAQRVAALQSLEQQAAGYVPSPGTSVFGKPDERSPFFFKLKLLTVLGYYTSQVGATSELAFNPVPARYDGNVDFASVGKQWTS
jgi:hypothetical protein